MDMTEEQIDQIEAYAKKLYQSLDFAHDISHMDKTVKLAQFIAQKEGADVEVCRIGAMIHQFHDNIDDLEGFLKSIGLSKKLVEKYTEYARFRPHRKVYEVPIEVKVVADADYLQVVGPYGLIREFACNIKTRKMSLSKGVDEARYAMDLLFKSLQTETGKKLATDPQRIINDFWKTFDDWEADKFD